MALTFLVLLSLVIAVVSLTTNLKTLNTNRVFCNTTHADGSFCPTWYYCNSTTSRCQCGLSHKGMIKCMEKTGTAAVINCYCMTYDNETGETQSGLCFYNCENTNRVTMYDNVFHPLPPNPGALNELMCSRFNRMGTLCGQCKQGHYPYVLSYNLSCVECPDGNKNWWKFILAGFVPLTFFYFFIIFFNINITSSRLHGVVLFSQALSMPALARHMFLAFETRTDLLKAVKVVAPFYTFWNLEFFRSILPGTCLNVSTLEAFALDYAIATYPLALIIVSYLLIQLYDNHVSCVIYLWKPFRQLFTMFKRNWDVRTSVIDSFATVFLLSYTKVLNCLLYTSPSPRDATLSRMPSSA